MVQPAFSSPKRSPKTAPQRKILHERSQSQTNTDPSRKVIAGAQQESYPTTPYPTKPAHVLLPTTSTRSQDGRSALPATSFASPLIHEKQPISGSENLLDVSSAGNTNPSGIKRSVSELRDLYERQVSRPPSTNRSTKPASNPTNAIPSPALRGQVLGERLSGKGRYHPSESDEDLALPEPRTASLQVKKSQSETSLPPLPPNPTVSSGSNTASAEDSSSPPDESSFTSASPNLIPIATSPSSPEHQAIGSSSPNFVLLGHSSSQDFHDDAHTSSPVIPPLRLSTNPPLILNSPSATETDAASFNVSSTPNSRSLATSSSPNVVTLGSSSPNYVTIKGSDSPDRSPDSLRTIQEIHHGNLIREQPSSSTFSTSSSSEKFSSSPPNLGKSLPSVSTLDLPLTSENEPQSSPLHGTTGSGARTTLQATIESSPAPEIQYPLVAAPRMHEWDDLHVQKRAPRPQRGEHSPVRWNPRLSTVPSEWTDEHQFDSFQTLDTADSADTSDTSDTQSIPELNLPTQPYDRDISCSTTRIVQKADRRESADIISDLHGPYLRNMSTGFLTIPSESSRNSSMRSLVLRRPNSNGTLNSTVRFPAWARCYYSQDPSDLFHFLRPETSSSNLSQKSRFPSTPVSANLFPSSSLFRPRTRAGKNAKESHLLPGVGPLVSHPSQSRLSSLLLDPADPRSHWAGAEQAAIAAELQDRGAVGSRPVDEWSPHLFPDNRAGARKHWLAPSIDEGIAPIFSERNIHMVSFMVGFIFPISWFVAALLPVPPRPAVKEMSHDPESCRMSLQDQLDHRTAVTNETRWANLHWWRSLNRFMSIVGLVVVAIVITLAVIGTRGGFATQ